MFAMLFRLLGYFILAGGIIVGIVDATRSVVANSLQLTSLGSTLESYVPSLAEWLAGAKAGLAAQDVAGWSPANVIDYVNAIPLAPLAAVLFLIIYSLASRNRAPRHF